MTNVGKGAWCLVASAFGFAVMGLCVRGADEFGSVLPATQKAFFRNLVAFAIAAVALWRTPSVLPRGVRTWGLLLLRATLGTLGIFANFYAISRLHLADALMLNKLAPFFTVLLSWLFIRERLTWRQALCLALAFAGAAFVVKPGGTGFAVSGAALAGVFGGFCAGGAYACVRELGIMRVPGAFIVFFFSLFSMLASVPFLVFDYHPMGWAQIATLLGAGAGAAMGQFGITAAYRFAEPRRIAALDHLNVVFAAMFGFVFFDQRPDWLSWCGFALIAAAAFAIARAAGKGKEG